MYTTQRMMGETGASQGDVTKCFAGPQTTSEEAGNLESWPRVRITMRILMFAYFIPILVEAVILSERKHCSNTERPLSTLIALIVMTVRHVAIHGMIAC